MWLTFVVIKRKKNMQSDVRADVHIPRYHYELFSHTIYIYTHTHTHRWWTILFCLFILVINQLDARTGQPPMGVMIPEAV